MHEINPATSTEINRLHQLVTKTAPNAASVALGAAMMPPVMLAPVSAMPAALRA
jgi:hypothetical protein